MDFVVVGFGLGALGVLLGVVMLGWLAPRAQQAAARATSGESAYELAIASEHRGTGRALLYAGSAMLLVTVGGLAGSLDDRTGALLVTTTATVGAIGIVLQGFLYRARNPIPPRRRTRPVPAADTFEVATGGVDATLRVAADDALAVTDESESKSEESFEGADGDDLPRMDTEADDTSPLLMTAEDELEAEAGGAAPIAEPPVIAAEPDAEDWRFAESPDHHEGDDTVPAEDEATVVIGYVVPAARVTGAAPSRPDEGEDPS